MKVRIGSAAMALVGTLALVACAQTPSRAPDAVDGGPSPIALAREAQARAVRELAKAEQDRLRWPEDRERFDRAARTAWAFLDRGYRPATGLMAPIGAYPHATIWDISSMIAGVYCAHELGLLDDEKYLARMRLMLDTLARAPLYDGRAFNKTYDTRTGQPSVSSLSPGWSTVDLGRLLIWLRIVRSEPEFETIADAIAARIDFSSIVKDGYLWGMSPDETGTLVTYPEGTIGYEQYAALGYALWGQRAEKALRLQENALPIAVMGQPMPADYRRRDRLTPEPFLLWGLEVGWDPATEALTRGMLLAMERRHQATGVVTMPGEDAIPKPPYWFYYYCLYANGLDFGVDVVARRPAVDGPRWISSKAAYAFDALMPTAYTALVLDAVDAAHGPTGWAAGVYEGTEETGKSTGNQSVNTAGIILTAALYQARGEPILTQAQARRPTANGP